MNAVNPTNPKHSADAVAADAVEADAGAAQDEAGAGAEGPADRSPRLTIGAAAHRLGVAVPTLRSWERRYGIGPRPQTPGTHRRYSPADMARLEYFCHLVGEGVATGDAARAALAREHEPAATSAAVAAAAPSAKSPHHAGGGHALPVGRGGSSARGLARCAVRLDQAQTLRILDEALARDGVMEAWEGTIKPALLAVGRKWTETQGKYVEVEHLLSWCVTTALHRFQADAAQAAASAAAGSAASAEPAQPDAAPAHRRVLLACAPDELHSLPLEVLGAALVERGATPAMFGAAVPADALREAVRRTDPARVVVWSQTSHTADPGALPVPGERSRCRVLPAGPGWLSARPAVPRVLLTLADALEACLA